MNIASLSFASLNVPLSPAGLGADTVWFGGGRLAAGVAAHGGIEKIVFFGNQPVNRSAFFVASARSAYAKIFKPYLLVEDKAYVLELTNTRLYPGGYRSSFHIPDQGIEVEHDLVLENDVLLHTLRVVRNARKKPLRLRISVHEYTRSIQEGRKWTPFRGDPAKNLFYCRVTDEKPKSKGESASTWVGVVSDRSLTTRLFHSQRRFFETSSFRSGSATTALLFGLTRLRFMRRATTLASAASRESLRVARDWEKTLKDAPILCIGEPVIESFFRLAPLILRGVIAADLPGAMRAAVSHYWVWAWDTLVNCDAYLAAGQFDFVRDALDLYHRTADPEKGIGHAFDTQMRATMSQPPCSQGLYPYALYQYVAYSGDTKPLHKHYIFARSIMELGLRTRGRAGLMEGPALFPDFPKLAGHNGHDFSVFNNAIFYQSARAMEQMAGWMNDAATQETWRRVWREVGGSFDRFWDAKRGYWFDSIDSRDLSPRPSYPSHAVPCISPFAGDLVSGKERRAADFMGAHLAYAGGIRMYPRWDKSFNADGNQMAQHYPPGTDPLFLKLSALAGRQDLIERWMGWVKAFWNQLTVPEGTTGEAENEGPKYPDCPGGKQQFSVKAWYMGILGSVVGVYFDAGGITAGPGLDRPVGVEGIYYGGRRWTIRTHGHGTFIRALKVNGVAISGTLKMPSDFVKSKKVALEIERMSSFPIAPQLLSADGGKLSRFRAQRTGFHTRIDAPGALYVRFLARRRPQVTWEGRPIDVSYDSTAHEGVVFLDPAAAPSVSGELAVEIP